MKAILSVTFLRDFQGLPLAKSHANESELDNTEYMKHLPIKSSYTASTAQKTDR